MYSVKNLAHLNILNFDTHKIKNGYVDNYICVVIFMPNHKQAHVYL